MSYEYERVITPASGLRLHLNENTAGCSPAVLEALGRLTRQDLAAYPGYDAAIAACAGRLGVGGDSLVLTNGLDEGSSGGAKTLFEGQTAGKENFKADETYRRLTAPKSKSVRYQARPSSLKRRPARCSR